MIYMNYYGGGEEAAGYSSDNSFGNSQTNESSNAASGAGTSGGTRTGGGFAGSIGYTAHGISNSIAFYGAWYEGEQLNDYYNKQAELTYRDKQNFIRKSEYQIGQIRMQTMDAERDVQTAKTLSGIKEKRYREETDGIIGAIMAKGADSGVDMSYGSPLDYLNKVIDDRAFDYDLMQWENKNEVYNREKFATSLKDKATIMLDEQKIQEQNFDYQAAIFKRAAGDARRTARYKSYQAGLNVG